MSQAHPDRCTCAYCRQAQGWLPMTVILKQDDWDWIAARGGTISGVIEHLIRDAQRRAG